jgi:hypothetical protein
LSSPPQANLSGIRSRNAKLPESESVALNDLFSRIPIANLSHQVLSPSPEALAPFVRMVWGGAPWDHHVGFSRFRCGREGRWNGVSTWAPDGLGQDRASITVLAENVQLIESQTVEKPPSATGVPEASHIRGKLRPDSVPVLPCAFLSERRSFSALSWS